jgi:hypothetical protein
MGDVRPSVYDMSNEMATADRIYSFRAPADLGKRLAKAREQFVEIAGKERDVDEWLIDEIAMAYARRLFRGAEEVARDQSAFMRTAVEILVRATEKVAYGLEVAPEYAAAAREDPEREEWLQAGVELFKEAVEREERELRERERRAKPDRRKHEERQGRERDGDE